MEFGYDGKHGAYQPHIVRASPPVAAVGSAHGSPAASPTGARVPPTSVHAP
jgi:hypothetical protein